MLLAKIYMYIFLFVVLLVFLVFFLVGWCFFFLFWFIVCFIFLQDMPEIRSLEPYSKLLALWIYLQVITYPNKSWMRTSAMCDTTLPRKNWAISFWFSYLSPWCTPHCLPWQNSQAHRLLITTEKAERHNKRTAPSTPFCPGCRNKTWHTE